MSLTVTFTIEELNDLDEPISFFDATNIADARRVASFIKARGGKVRTMRVVLNGQGRVIDKEEVP